MIRSRMSFDRFTDSNGSALTNDEALELCRKDQFSGVNVRLWPVYTPDPTNPNSKWAAATPSGQVQLFIQNPAAIENLVAMLQQAEEHGRKNAGYPTREFYVDIYPAPAED